MRRKRDSHLQVMVAVVAVAVMVGLFLLEGKAELEGVRSYDARDAGNSSVWRPDILSGVVTERVSVYPGGYLDFIVRNLVPGGPGRDGIPSIDDPAYVTADEATLDDMEVVIGADFDGVTKAYPLRIMRWHEVVNDMEGGRRVSVTYSPLAGTAIGFVGKELGVSGSLYSSNLVLYDRETGALYPQMLGIAVAGREKGEALGRFPVIMASWAAWRRQHPNTLVLSEKTGHERDYSLDPYEGYAETPRIWFPVAATCDLLQSKEVVTGVELGGRHLAIPKDAFREVGEATYGIGGETLHIAIDPYLDIIRVTAASGEAVDAIEAYWFAWYAYYPDTEVYGK